MPEVRRPVLALAAALIAAPYVGLDDGVQGLVCHSFGLALFVWYAVTGRDLPASNLLVRCGEWTYGLYLVHVTIILAAYCCWSGRGKQPSDTAVVLVGVLATGLGLAYGMAECRLYRLLRTVAWARRPEAPRQLPTANRAA